MSARDFALLRAKMHDALGKSAFLQETSSSSWSSTDSKWSEKSSRKSSTTCNNWALIVIPILFLSVVAFYFIIVDVGLVSTLLEEKENKTITSEATLESIINNLKEIETTTQTTIQTSTTTIRTTTEEEITTPKTTTFREVIKETTETYRYSPSTFKITRRPELRTKLPKTNSTLITLKKNNNGTQFVIEGSKFRQHDKDILEVVNAPDLRIKHFRTKGQSLDVHPMKPLTTPRGFHYTPTVPLIARLQAERTDSTTSINNDTDEYNCFSPRIPFCEGVLPYDMVQLPTMLDVTSARDLDAMLPYFHLIVQSGCSLRAKEFICSVLEPECRPIGTKQASPCKGNCKVIAEDCKDFILETLPLSRVFDCRRYPDWNENQECVNLSKGKCYHGEFRCPDGSCIPQSWVCDGVHDCPGAKPAVDEHLCSGCSSHEFRCIMDGKCVPKNWQCDGHADCSDNSDESSC